jgi:hypothetical protein
MEASQKPRGISQGDEIYLALKGSLIGGVWSASAGRPEAHDLLGCEHDTTRLVGRIIFEEAHHEKAHGARGASHT